MSLGHKAVLDTFAFFTVTYVSVRRAGESRRLLFTTAEAGPRDDLLSRWREGDRDDATIGDIRALLVRRAARTNAGNLDSAIAWLDEEPRRWTDSADAVEWRFGAPDIGEVREEIKHHLALRTVHLPTDLLTDRLLAEVLQTSSQREPSQRLKTASDLQSILQSARAELEAWAVGLEATRLRVALGEVEDLDWLLTDGRRPLLQNPSPGRLLTAAHEVVPFEESGRHEALDALAEWCSASQKTSVFLIVGEGGSGKTRLLVEWCRRLSEQGWHTGFLKLDLQATQIRPLFTGALPKLVVVDYAETRREILVPLLSEAGTRKVDPPLRVVLLARREADWVEDLALRRTEIRYLLAERHRLRLDDFVPEAGRREAFEAAISAFGRVLGRPETSPRVPLDLSRVGFERALFLHMAALAALDGLAVESAEEALTATLDRERLYWSRQASDLAGTDPVVRTLERCLTVSVTLLTLLGGAADESTAQKIVHRAAKRKGLPVYLEADLLTLLRHLYGTSDKRDSRVLEALEPDLLGETLVASALRQDEVFLDDVFSLADKAGALNALTVLTRLALRDRDAEQWLEAALRPRLTAEFAALAMEVAVETGDPIGRVLGRLIEQANSIELTELLARELGDARFRDSVPLFEAGAAAARKLFQARMAEWTDRTLEQRAQLAKLASNLSYRLYSLGRAAEALEASSEAVEIYRQLADEQPDEFLARFAGSLINFGRDLFALGQIHQGLQATAEAVAIYRRLPSEELSGLAQSLSNLGNALGRLGRWDEAVAATSEAIALWRELKTKETEGTLPKLARSLYNLSSQLRDLGRHGQALEAAQEAVSILRPLAGRRPDTFLPDLARSLNNVGVHLAELGAAASALAIGEEAVQIQRWLAAERPNAFLVDLAIMLNNLGARLSAANRYEEALKVSTESVTYYRRLTAELPDSFLPALAGSLGNLSSRFFENGEFEKALEVCREAVHIHRQLAAREPDALSSHLAVSLINLGARLRDLGRREEALATTSEAVSLLRQLAVNRSDSFRPQLARSLHNLGVQLNDLGRTQEALEVTTEVVELQRQIASQRPEMVLDLASALSDGMDSSCD